MPRRGDPPESHERPFPVLLLVFPSNDRKHMGRSTRGCVALVSQSSWSEPSRDGYAFHRMRSGVDDGLMRHPGSRTLVPKSQVELKNRRQSPILSV